MKKFSEYYVLEVIATAYLNTKERIESGLKVNSAAMQPCWEVIQDCCQHGNVFLKSNDTFLNFYEIVLMAATKYERTPVIGIDAAFSTILEELGIRCNTSDWYRVMAFHYLKQAEKKERDA